MKILVVEDEVRLARALRRGLVAEGFVVDLAHDGRDGLWAARNRPYDVVILDIMLPLANGYDVCRAMRASRVWTPVLMLTAKDGDYDQVDGLDIGADDYLVKPVPFHVLVARIRALLRRGAPERPTTLRIDDLELDPASHTVRRAGTPVALTAREFGLLHYLMCRPGDVVSKSDILQHVWDSMYDGDDNVVEVYVGYLRKKVDRPFGKNSIRTVRGSGYQLVAE